MTRAVTLDVWRVPPRFVPTAFWWVAALPRRTRTTASFVKLLGTGRGSRFGPGSVDLCRWAALTVWLGTPHRYTGLDGISTAHCRLTLLPISSRGRWSGQIPFQTTKSPEADDSGSPILVLTRARLRPTRMVAFWKAITPVSIRLATAPGLLAAFGVGEAPIGFQGTVSIWAGARDVSAFAYRTAEHASVVAKTMRQRWYAEELFARLAVLDVVGDREVLGWNAERA